MSTSAGFVGDCVDPPGVPRAFGPAFSAPPGRVPSEADRLANPLDQKYDRNGAAFSCDPTIEHDQLTQKIVNLLEGMHECQSRANDKTELEFRGQWHPKPNGAETGHGVVPKDWALATVSENDRELANYGWAGGAALCLSNAFAESNKMLAQAQDLVDQGFSDDHPQVQCIRALARTSEERESVMRKQWCDIEFQEGEASNQELLKHLERDFAGQIAKVAARVTTKDKEDELHFLRGSESSGGSSSSSMPRRPWYNVKVNGGTEPGKTYLAADMSCQFSATSHGASPLCLSGCDDESGRQRWRIEGAGGDFFRLRLAGGTTGDKRLLSIFRKSPAANSSVSDFKVGLSSKDDGFRMQWWRIIEGPGEGKKVRWFLLQSAVSDMLLSVGEHGQITLSDKDSGTGRERWVIPGYGSAQEGDLRLHTQPKLGSQVTDQIAVLAARAGSDATPSLAELSTETMTRVLNDNRNLGAAIDLVGCYLKNYEIDKADQICRRIEPLCRERGGLWLLKFLNFFSTVRMKQSRHQEALAIYEEYDSLIDLNPDEHWELYDTVYRNFGWIHCSLGNHAKAFDFFQRCVEIKQKNGVPPHWFDQWDLGKTHARLSVQKANFSALKHSLDLIKKGIDLHQQVEKQDKVMLCKMLNSAGECASVLGDFSERDAGRKWHEEAVSLHRRAFEIYVRVLGKNKPLTGWCMEHLAGALRRLDAAGSREEAKRLFIDAFFVECSKDIIKLSSMDRLLGCILELHDETQDQYWLARCQNAINVGLENLRKRKIFRTEAASYASLLRRIAHALLIHDAAANRLSATELLREALSHVLDAVDSIGKQTESPAGGVPDDEPFLPKAGDQGIAYLDPRQLAVELEEELSRAESRSAAARTAFDNLPGTGWREAIGEITALRDPSRPDCKIKEGDVSVDASTSSPHTIFDSDMLIWERVD